jgi:hypothetical protein
MGVNQNVDNQGTEQAVGTIQAVDVPGRTLTMLVNGVSRIFEIAPDCAIVLRGERVKLRLVQPSDTAHLVYRQTAEGLRAQVVDVN